MQSTSNWYSGFEFGITPFLIKNANQFRYKTLTQTYTFSPRFCPRKGHAQKSTGQCKYIQKSIHITFCFTVGMYISSGQSHKSVVQYLLLCILTLSEYVLQCSLEGLWRFVACNEIYTEMINMDYRNMALTCLRYCVHLRNKCLTFKH